MKKIIQSLSCLFLFLLPWQTIWIYSEPMINGVKWQYGTLGFYITELLAWLIIILFLSQYFRVIKKNYLVTDSNFGFDRLFVTCFLLLVVYFFLSSFWSAFPDLARQQALRITAAFLLFIIFSTNFISFAKAKTWFIYGSIVPSMLGIWQFLSQSTFSSTIFGLAAHPAEEMGSAIVAFGDERWLRAYGSFAHPNIFGGYLVFVLFFIFLFWLEQKKNNSKKSEQYLMIFAAMLAVSALFMTFSRSAWLSFTLLFIGTGIIYIKKQIGIRFHMMLAVLPVVFTLLFLHIVVVRLGLGSYQEYLSLAERSSLMVGAKQIIAAHPWFGTGVGNYTAAMYAIDPSLSGWLYQPVHVVLLLFFAEVGAIGLLLWLFGFIAFFLCFKNQLLAHRHIVLIGMAMVLPLLLFDHYLYSSYIGLISATFLLISLTHSSEK